MIGNIASDIDSRTTQSGISNCTFRLAVQRRYTNSDGVREADFIPIVCWRQTAESCAKHLSKGKRIAVEGSIQTRSYEAQDGSKRWVTEIIADHVEFLSPKEANDASATMEAASKVFGTPVDEDDLPF